MERKWYEGCNVRGGEECCKIEGIKVLRLRVHMRVLIWRVGGGW